MALPHPSNLFFQLDDTRRMILASYWVVILLATPLWWNITSIERLSLPASRVNNQFQTVLSFQTTIQLDPLFVAENSSVINDLQVLLDERVPKELVLTVQTGSESTAPGLYHLSPSNTPEIWLLGRHMTFPPSNSLTQLADMLAILLAPYPTTPEYRVAPYASRYRLAFTLLNEDASAGSYMAGWDIEASLNRHIQPIISRMNVLHNFTIESQVQFHAPLAFNLQSLEDGSFGLTLEDLTVFVNSAEWSLASSSSTDPVLHFVLFVPSIQNRPLKIMESRSNTFLIPQWGAVVIHNPLDTRDFMSAATLENVFPSFSQHLLSLLGLPRLPSDVSCSDDISAWQHDSLLRRRALENVQGAKDILRSTVTLVQQIENMPVGAVVRNDVEAALSALEKLHELESISLLNASQYSADAVTIASRAFFNPGMLALLYFPPEHRYAVYTPLFASAVIPLFAAALREFLAWKRQGKQPLATTLRE